MTFDPSRCQISVTPLPAGNLLTDPTIPDELSLIPDCSSFELPTLFPEAPCPEIFSSPSQVHFNFIPANAAPTPVPLLHSVAVGSDDEGCINELALNLNPPCLNVSTAGAIQYVPFTTGPTILFEAVTDRENQPNDSISLLDYCSLTLQLTIGLPAQPCPDLLAGTATIGVVPPDEAGSFTAVITKILEDTSDSINNTACLFVVDLDLQAPCTGMDVTGGPVNYVPGNREVSPGGITKVVILSAIPCNFEFQVVFDIDGVYFEPQIQPGITDLCIRPDGTLQSAQVTYTEWPTGDIVRTLWRSQFGFCDENRCFSVPLDYGLHNTGCDNSNNALSDVCQNDSHWNVGASPAKSMAYADYPAIWMRPGRRSRWIAQNCDGLHADSAVVTFKTTLTLPVTVSEDSFAVEGILICDNWITDIRVNGESIEVPGLTDTYPGLNNFRLAGPMYHFLLKANFQIGINLIEFEVTNGGPGVSWVGLRVEWTGVGICGGASTTTTTSTSTSTTTTSTSSTTSTTAIPTTRPPPAGCSCPDSGEPYRPYVRLFQPAGDCYLTHYYPSYWTYQAFWAVAATISGQSVCPESVEVPLYYQRTAYQGNDTYCLYTSSADCFNPFTPRNWSVEYCRYPISMAPVMLGVGGGVGGGVGTVVGPTEDFILRMRIAVVADIIRSSVVSPTSFRVHLALRGVLTWERLTNRGGMSGIVTNREVAVAWGLPTSCQYPYAQSAEWLFLYYWAAVPPVLGLTGAILTGGGGAEPGYVPSLAHVGGVYGTNTIYGLQCGVSSIASPAYSQAVLPGHRPCYPTRVEFDPRR